MTIDKTYWQQLPERSNAFWIRLIIAITKRLGRNVSRWLLYPISLYFLLVNNTTRPAYRRFFQNATGREPRFWDSFRQYHTFAASLLDRMAVLLGNEHDITLHYHGLEHFEPFLKAHQGGVLVGSHLGNFDILRMVANTKTQCRIKVVMYGGATPQLVEVFKALNPSLHENLITLPGPSAIVGLLPEVEEGLCIGVLGDRVMAGERSMTCDFLGTPAIFPTTPAYLADILHVPILQFFCIQTRFGHYEIYFEPLSNGMGGSRDDRQSRIENVTRCYVRNLERHARLAPDNWFNFHDVWPVAE